MQLTSAAQVFHELVHTGRRLCLHRLECRGLSGLADYVDFDCAVAQVFLLASQSPGFLFGIGLPFVLELCDLDAEEVEEPSNQFVRASFPRGGDRVVASGAPLVVLELLHELVQAQVEQETRQTSLAGNALEALIGAIYLDRGYNFTEKVVQDKILAMFVDLNSLEQLDFDPKSKLIERSQKERFKLVFNTRVKDPESKEKFLPNCKLREMKE